MDREQVEKWATKAARSDHSRLLGCGMDDLTRFAIIARNAALDEAAAMCRDQFPKYYGGNMAAFRQCAIAIESLKEPQP